MCLVYQNIKERTIRDLKKRHYDYVAKGMYSGLVYAYGRYRSEIFKNLKQDYPYELTTSGKRTTKRSVYVEPLVIEKGVFNYES